MRPNYTTRYITAITKATAYRYVHYRRRDWQRWTRICHRINQLIETNARRR